jgi:hypothetical protein
MAKPTNRACVNTKPHPQKVIYLGVDDGFY